MRSLRELYRTGTGPSSSHTMAPRAASRAFLEKFPQGFSYRVTLFGSLAATGKGHLTDLAISSEFAGRDIEIIWKANEELPLHTNGMRFESLDSSGKTLDIIEDYSIGGGALLSEPSCGIEFSESNTAEILKVLENNFSTFWEYLSNTEGEDIYNFLKIIWEAMEKSISNGLSNRGTIPGGIKLPRKASAFFNKSSMLEKSMQMKARLISYAYAVSEENASGGTIVTAPTCGASGVIPAVIYGLKKQLDLSEETIVHALGTAGLFGNIVKSNGSISGAYVGCQGEVGVACAMAAAAACQILGGSPQQIEYAAEMGLEHHLGLVCDPVLGLVQIPCIERNAHAALRALDCAHFAILSDGSHRISFDDAVSVLLENGESMSKDFKETSQGGLARIYQQRINELPN